MKLKDLQNEGVPDRFIRILVAETFFLGAYFWTSGIWQIILYALGIIGLVTSLTGFCALYKILRIKTTTTAPLSVYAKIGSLIVFLIVAIAGSYYSAFFTKKLFLDDYNRMNTYYKQTLFYTGQEQRDAAIANYDSLVNQYSAFYEKYTIYHPYAIRSDSQFNSDIGKVSTTITSLKETVYSGSLQEAHLSLESVRPLFQDILKRNNFSLLAISLVDFHDAMEKILTAADKKDSSLLLATYPEVDAKLQTIENIVDDSEIQAIRSRLEEVAALAKSNQVDLLSVKAAELKSAFVKVYLKRG